MPTSVSGPIVISIWSVQSIARRFGCVCFCRQRDSLIPHCPIPEACYASWNNASYQWMNLVLRCERYVVVASSHRSHASRGLRTHSRQSPNLQRLPAKNSTPQAPVAQPPIQARTHRTLIFETNIFSIQTKLHRGDCILARTMQPNFFFPLL